MRAVFFTILMLATYASAQESRQLRPQRQPELYQQGCRDCAQGIWWSGYLIGAIGWDGYPVPAGAQVVLKGRNFADKPVLVLLRYSRYGDLADSIYLLPRLAYDLFPRGMESCGFTLPPFVAGPVAVTLFVDGRLSNEVYFEVR